MEAGLGKRHALWMASPRDVQLLESQSKSTPIAECIEGGHRQPDSACSLVWCNARRNEGSLKRDCCETFSLASRPRPRGRSPGNADRKPKITASLGGCAGTCQGAPKARRRSPKIQERGAHPWLPIDTLLFALAADWAEKDANVGLPRPS